MTLCRPFGWSQRWNCLGFTSQIQKDFGALWTTGQRMKQIASCKDTSTPRWLRLSQERKRMKKRQSASWISYSNAHRRLPEWLEPADPFIALLMWLAIDRENSWALETIEDTFFKEPIRFANPPESCCVLGYEELRQYRKISKHLKLACKERRAIAWLSRSNYCSF